MILDNVNIKRLVNAIILVILVISIAMNVFRGNSINALENKVILLANEQEKCEQISLIYETRIENLSNIINVKDIQIDNITKMNVTLTEQVRQMKRDYDKLMEHYVTTHDSLLKINKKIYK